MIAAESRSHIGLFYDNLDFTDKHYTVFNLINKKAASKPQIVSQVMVMKVTKVNVRHTLADISDYNYGVATLHLLCKIDRIPQSRYSGTTLDHF